LAIKIEMTKTFNTFILTFLLMVAFVTVKAQLLPKVQGKFAAYQLDFQEKLFAHTDKEQYVAGELLWLKIYTINSVTGKPTTISKLAYVELLDQNNKPFVQAKISLANGSGNGSLVIPTDLKNGVYKFRAYTNWMKNFGPELFFEKQVTILNGQYAPEKVEIDKNNIDLQFFPEGGDLVEGITANVGFKAMGSNGKGINVNGAILNQKNDTVAKFKSFKFGIGQFKFTPQSNTTYRAVIVSGGTPISNTFPTIKKQGYVLSVTDNGASLQVDVATNLNSAKVYVFIHNKEAASFVALANIVGGKASFQIEQSKIEPGISHITLFNEQEQAVAERLYFKGSTKKISIDAKTLLSTYSVRSKVDVSISVKGEVQNLTDLDLSLSVRKLDSLQDVEEGNIESYLQLSSELKGSIEAPNYYFNTSSSDARTALNNLLITQGWRRFAWDKVLDEKPQFKFLPEYNGHLINGKIVDKNGKGTGLVHVYLGVAGKRSQFYESVSDDEGDFVFNTNDFYGNNEIVVQADQSDSTSNISILSPFSERYTPSISSKLIFDKSLWNAFQLQSLGVQVQNSYMASQLNKFLAPKVDSLSFYGHLFKTYKFNDYTRFRTMEETLREYVTETMVSKSDKDFHINLVSKDITLRGDPLVLIDGIPYFNINNAMQIDPNKIERLEVVVEAFYLGSSKFEGVLSFFSYKPSLANIDLNPKAVVLDYEGMQAQREFYTPVYETAAQMNSRLPDFRNVLYWLPNLKIDPNGTKTVNFYSSDLPGTYVGTINGIDKNGNPATTTFSFQVKEKN
jgi:hypothetical protein